MRWRENWTYQNGFRYLEVSCFVFNPLLTFGTIADEGFRLLSLELS